jgi:hypothetical protein
VRLIWIYNKLWPVQFCTILLVLNVIPTHYCASYCYNILFIGYGFWKMYLLLFLIHFLMASDLFWKPWFDIRTMGFAPGLLMKFFSGMSTLVPLVWIFCDASLLEALV